ncbi:hypothetical protein [Paraburkholderia acidisoli]|uniref:Uncharacterized protein n=1 Tax=Paraburkholderia acidisoli TaxID=2571748 RepID=A0A7Z2JJ01_9BURK|nr:hypothetical protein [Paraburkholderia acidisoli]QGZ66291.1 hypothetical protein FAZ98_31335 [Paraburkholderia acidisoli]
MTLDESNLVDDLLVSWHRWQEVYAVRLGLPRCDSTCRAYQLPVDRLSADEAAAISDLKIWKRNGETVDALVEGLTWQQRAGLQTTLRNKRIGYDVFKSERFSKEEIHIFFQQAKEALYPKFVARGLIKISAEAA